MNKVTTCLFECTNVCKCTREFVDLFSALPTQMKFLNILVYGGRLKPLSDTIRPYNYDLLFEYQLRINNTQ